MNKKEYAHLYYLRNRERILARTTQYRREHKEQTSLAKKRHRQLNRELLSGRDKVRKERLKVEVLSHYGRDSKASCIVCGEDRLPCLSIDHIEGGGNKETRRGITFYYWLKKSSYPEGFQTLCMNCQWMKRHTNREYGGG